MEVRVIDRAVEQLEKNYRWWAKHRSQPQAARWYNGFLDAILALEENPQQHPLAAESADFPYEVRELHFGLGSRPTHRALFTIRPDCVAVFSIRHAAQGPASPDNL